MADEQTTQTTEQLADKDVQSTKAPEATEADEKKFSQK